MGCVDRNNIYWIVFSINVFHSYINFVFVTLLLIFAKLKNNMALGYIFVSSYKS